MTGRPRSGATRCAQIQPRAEARARSQECSVSGRRGGDLIGQNQSFSVLKGPAALFWGATIRGAYIIPSALSLVDETYAVRNRKFGGD